MKTPSQHFRAVCFTLYGLAIGALVASFLFTALRYLPWLAAAASLVVVAAFGFSAWAISRHEVALWRRMLIVPVAPLALLGGVIGLAVFLLCVVFCLPFLIVAGHRREFRFRQMLCEQGRLISLAELAPALESGQGTLLEVHGPKGAHCLWWTKDDLASHEPAVELKDRWQLLFRNEQDETSNVVRHFNSLCLSEYIASEGGKASLLMDIAPRRARTGELFRRYPKIRKVIVIPPG